MKWRFYTVPQKKGDPGSETWPNEEVMKHGGGMTWMPVTYDPDAQSDLRDHRQSAAGHRAQEPRRRQPVHRLDRRAQCRHRHDGVVLPGVAARHARLGCGTQTPVLIDGRINGQPRKLLAQASRNGHFFVLDRATGKSIVSTEFVKTNWSLGYDERGQPIPNPAKMPQIDGALVSPNQGGAANWQSPSFSPATGLFYVNATARLQRVLHLRSER